MSKEKERRTLSLRIDKNLADEVDRLSALDGRNFNSQVQELIRKGIELVESERRFLKQVEPLHIVRTISEDYDPKKPRNPDSELDSEKKGGARELA